MMRPVVDPLVLNVIEEEARCFTTDVNKQPGGEIVWRAAVCVCRYS